MTLQFCPSGRAWTPAHLGGTSRRGAGRPDVSLLRQVPHGRILLQLSWLLWLLGQAPGASSEPIVAVVGVHAAPGLETEAASLTPKLRDAFRNQGAFSTLSEAAILEALAGRQPDLREAVFVAPAREALEKARELAGRAEFQQAILSLQAAETHLLYYREHLTTDEVFLETEQFLLQLLLGLGEHDRALDVMRRLATVAPGLHLDPLRFSRQSIEMWQRVTSELRYCTGIEITSEPSGATAYLDGRSVGPTPLFLPRVPQGRHYIRLEGVGGVFFQDLVLTSSDEQHIHGVLESPRFHRAGPLPDLETVGSQTAEVGRLRALYGVLGQALKADFLVVAVLDPGGVEATLFRVSDRRFSPSYRVFLDARRPGPRPLQRLATELERFVQMDTSFVETLPLDQTPDPDTNRQLLLYFFQDRQSLLASASNPTGTHTRGRFLRSPWFWGAAGGTLAIAAGAAGYFMARDQNSSTGTVSIRFQFP